MSWIAKWKRRRHDMKIEKAHNDLQDEQLHEVEKHKENLVLRSQIVAQELARRRATDPWADTVARIARNQN